MLKIDLPVEYMNKELPYLYKNKMYYGQEVEEDYELELVPEFTKSKDEKGKEVRNYTTDGRRIV